MTHTNDARQCIPVRLDQYVNHDPRLIIKARLVFKARPLLAQLRQTPSLYSRPGLYLRPGFYSRKYGTQSCKVWILLDSGNLYLIQIRLSDVYQALFVTVVLLTSPSLLWHCWLHNIWWTWSKYPPQFLFWGRNTTYLQKRLRQTECVHYSALVMCSCVSAAKKAREQLNVVSIKLLNVIGEMQ